MTSIAANAALIAAQLQAAAAKRPPAPAAAPGAFESLPLKSAKPQPPAAAEDLYADARGRREAPLAERRGPLARPGALLDIKV